MEKLKVAYKTKPKLKIGNFRIKSVETEYFIKSVIFNMFYLLLNTRVTLTFVYVKTREKKFSNTTSKVKS